MRVHLGGHLNWYDPEKRAWFDLHLPEPISLLQLMQQLHVPPGEVAVVAVNGGLVQVEQGVVADTDRVELFPPVGGGTF